MSADELRKAAEAAERSWEDASADEVEDLATTQVVVGVLRGGADYYESIPVPVRASLLVLARLVNGEPS